MLYDLEKFIKMSYIVTYKIIKIYLKNRYSLDCSNCYNKNYAKKNKFYIKKI